MDGHRLHVVSVERRHNRAFTKTKEEIEGVRSGVVYLLQLQLHHGRAAYRRERTAMWIYYWDPRDGEERKFSPSRRGLLQQLLWDSVDTNLDLGPQVMT